MVTKPTRVQALRSKLNHIQINLNDPIMKSVYTLATVLATLLVLNASAQYTAVRNGDWSAPVGPLYVWDLSGQSAF